MRIAAAFAAIMLCCAVPVTAQEPSVTNGPVPAWVTASDLLPVPDGASGPMFVRRQDVLVHLDKRGQSQYTGYRIKILHSSALQMGNISIVWNPASGNPVVHSIKIYRNGEVIDVLAKSSFEILRREDQLEQAKLDGNLTGVLRIGDLRVGDELEVAFTTPLADPTLGDRDSGYLFLAPNPAPGRYRLALSWDQGYKPGFRLTDDMAAVARVGEASLDFRFDNPPLIVPPKDTPPRYQWQRIVEYSDFADWQAVSRQFAPLFSKASTLSKASPVHEEVRRIAAAYPDALGRASAALKLVQQDVRYIYVGLDGGNLTRASADDTWQRRYGDCKAKTALLLAMLKALGIDAQAVLVNASGADDGMDQRLPSPRIFDHVLVRAQIDGTEYWLDGTFPPVVPPSTDPVVPYRWVLPLTAEGSTIVRRPLKLDSKRPDQVVLYEIDARAGFDKPARIVSSTILHGVKALEQQVQLSPVTPADLLAAMRQQMVGDIWQEIDDVKWRFDEKAQASIMTISGTGIVQWDKDDDGGKSLALPGGGFSPPERRVRAAGQKPSLPFYNAPEYSCYVTTVRVPVQTNAGQWTYKPGFDTHIFGKNYFRAFEFRDGAIRMVRGFRVEQTEFGAAQAAQDNDRIAGFDNSMAWIFYNPAGRNGRARKDADVPATYDIDWTADAVPCLSAQALR